MATKFINAILEYLQHTSTWAGIIVGITALGIQIAPDLQDAIVKAGAAVFSAFYIFVVDRNVDKTTPVVTPPAA